jgi:hypothetical protein
MVLDFSPKPAPITRLQVELKQAMQTLIFQAWEAVHVLVMGALFQTAW